MATSSISGRAGYRPAVFAPPKPQAKSGLSKQLDRIGDFMLKYWAHIITILLGLLVFAALSVPFLSYFGLDSISKPLFYALHYVCAQVPSHSFYIFGHQLGMCARNFSIYASMFLGSLVFVLSKKRLPGIPWWVWVLMMVPIALDGLTQMFGLRESNWILRVVTGSLFGLGNIWFALPLMQKSLETPVLPAYYMAAQSRGMALAGVPQAMMPAPVVPASAPMHTSTEIDIVSQQPEPTQQTAEEKSVASNDPA